MRVAVATDEAGATPEAVSAWLVAAGHDVVEVVPGGVAPWPDVGHAVGEAVASGVADAGVVCCWTGTGVTMAANKLPGVRAALCTDAATAEGARRWNDANVLGISLRLVTPAVADELCAAFFGTGPDADGQDLISRVEPDGGPASGN